MMITSRFIRAGFALSLLLALSAHGQDTDGAASVNSLDAEQVRTTVAQVGDWALANPVAVDPRSWIIAPLYSGLLGASQATGDPRYTAAVLRAGQRVLFKSGSRRYHADGMAAGRAWILLYIADPDKPAAVLKPFKDQFDYVVAHPLSADLQFGRSPPPGIRTTDRWTWSDALFMAPPTLVVLAQATDDQKYLKFMDSEYAFAVDKLLDEQENLFWRDSRKIGELAPNGQPKFWSRGNAWVYAGLALVLEDLPADYPNRKYYVDLFRKMSAALLPLQQPDGFWYPSLMDPEQVPQVETSGTALFVAGMAFGVERGLLDAATYWPAVELGWKGLLTQIGIAGTPIGSVHGVQPVEDVPAAFDPKSEVAFGTGAVLMAGSAILSALDALASENETELFERAKPLADTSPDLSSICKGPCEPAPSPDPDEEGKRTH